MATVVDARAQNSSGLLIAVAVVVAVIALVAVNFAYNGQHLSVTPAVEAPGTPAPPATTTP